MELRAKESLRFNLKATDRAKNNICSLDYQNRKPVKSPLRGFRRKIIDIFGKDITKRKPSTEKCLSNLKIGKKSLRAYGGCLGFQRRRRTW